MQAIRVRYFGPTNVRGSRLKADCASASITIDYPHEYSGEECYRQACNALVAKCGWTEKAGYPKMVGGQLASGEYVFVFCEREG